uniref:Intraflagellar transport protein 56 n=1 Tax=Hydra vulgaris TaxID=6087 RepID=T2MK78_HYDVU
MMLQRQKPSISVVDNAQKETNNKRKLPKLEDFLEKRDYTGAVTLLEFTRQAGKESDEIGLWIAYSLFHSGEYERAMKEYQAILKKKNNQPDVMCNLACCYFMLGMYKEAQQALSNIKKTDLSNRLAFHLSHKFNDESNLMSHHSQLQDVIEDQLSLASIHYLRSHFQEAIDIYKRILLDNREYYALNVYVALCYYKLDYFDVSQEVLSVYLQHYPDSAIAINLKACNHFKLYNGKAAEADLKSLQEITSPSFTYAKDIIKHNMVVFKNGEGALQVLPALLDALPEARLNLVIYYLKQDYKINHNLTRDQRKAFKEINQDKKIDIYPFDKVIRFMGIEHDKAVQKIREQIVPSKIISIDPTLSYLSKLNKKQLFSKDENESIYLSDPVPPRLYGLIKAHKQVKSYPMRVTFSFCRTKMAPVRELSFEQRVCIVLLDGESVSERKIAERMKISLEFTIQSSISRKLFSFCRTKMAPVRKLSFEQRVCIVLLDGESVSERKIAERIKISLEFTIQSSISRKLIMLLIQNEKMKNDYVYISWLARIYVMNRKARLAWELYLKMETSSESFSLLQLIANDCYKTGQFYYAAKSFDVLERLDPNPEYWEGKRGACVGIFQMIIANREPRETLRDVLQLLRNTSNPQVEYILRTMKKWAKENRILVN